ncbi:hypothetical protein QYE76_068938 [Lolium multiflorum]|uniref:BHLH domain-containing protein n=1 Tax=Lolium multiflorum TaxID=4521 RepID=A0AAD8SH43_LOLMU|nr:hypothetical protein QYE76_068938 [Lolium multiflorum]
MGLTAADYGHLRHHLPSFQSLQTPTLFATRGSESYFGSVDGSIYSGGDVRPSLMQFGYAQPDSPDAATHMLTWTAEGGEPMANDGSSSKRPKTTRSTATTTAQGPQRRLQGSAKPRNQAAKAPCKRSQKLGDKITALQQLVSPYGKTDTASVLHEAAACIRSLHEQIQILAAPLPGASCSSPSSQDTGEEPATSLRRQGLCVAPLSAAVASLVCDNARGHGHNRTDLGAGAFFGAL